MNSIFKADCQDSNSQEELLKTQYLKIKKNKIILKEKNRKILRLQVEKSKCDTEIKKLTSQVYNHEIKINRITSQKNKLVFYNINLHKKIEVIEKIYNDCRRKKIHIYKENIILRFILLGYTVFFSLFLLYR